MPVHGQRAAVHVGLFHGGGLFQFFLDADQFVKYIVGRLAITAANLGRPAENVDTCQVDAVTGRIYRASLGNHRNLAVVAVINHRIQLQIAGPGGIGQLHPLKRLGLVHLAGKDIAVADFGIGNLNRLIDQAVDFFGRGIAGHCGIRRDRPHHQFFGPRHQRAEIFHRAIGDFHPGLGILDIGLELFVLHQRAAVLHAANDPHRVVGWTMDPLAVRHLFHQTVLGVQRFVHPGQKAVIHHAVSDAVDPHVGSSYRPTMPVLLISLSSISSMAVSIRAQPL